mmetsp:Transcript_22388/g.54706  ORF Transcript_22388/g.54706 Transcript_22388/m.54706 type:complete len:227 (-) Transcript_22388:90-770(-)
MVDKNLIAEMTTFERASLIDMDPEVFEALLAEGLDDGTVVHEAFAESLPIPVDDLQELADATAARRNGQLAEEPRARPPATLIMSEQALEAKAGTPASYVKLTAVTDCKRQAEEERERFKRERRDLKRKRGDEDVPADAGNSKASMKEKYERRLHLNRESAAASRARRDVYTNLLEDSLTRHEMELHTVRAENRSLAAELLRLKKLLAGLDSKKPVSTAMQPVLAE